MMRLEADHGRRFSNFVGVLHAPLRRGEESETQHIPIQSRSSKKRYGPFDNASFMKVGYRLYSTT
jgi:hypothetical protein